MSGILITGGSGFIGRHLSAHLADNGHRVILAGRKVGVSPSGQEAVPMRPYDLLDKINDSDGLFEGIDTVVHLAGLAHKPSASILEYRQMNQDATAELALAAARHGIRHFILMSTVKVHGESTAVTDGHYTALTEQSPLLPGDDYSNSKLQAERLLQDICGRYDMKYTILRPPLVFGPGVRANFLRLIKAVRGHWPLPLAAIRNRRSLIYVGNLSHIVGKLINHPDATNRTYLVKDVDYSTPELVHSLAKACAVRTLLFPVPDVFLGMLGGFPNFAGTIARLRESLVIDDSMIRRELDWTPPVPAAAAIEETIGWYMTSRR